jgi:RNA recognition motif. (a.k.a. RRM, RBD, or RNP domain)
MSLFVGNVSRNVNTRDLEKAFGKYGDCEVDLRVKPFSLLIP